MPTHNMTVDATVIQVHSDEVHKKDDGANEVWSVKKLGGTMKSEEGRIVEKIMEKIVTNAVSSATLSFPPSWVIKNACKK